MDKKELTLILKEGEGYFVEFKENLSGIEKDLVAFVNSEDKPCRSSSGFYKRIGSNSQKMTRNEILDFFKSEGKVRFDEVINTKFNYAKDFSREKLKKFLELAGLSNALSAEKILASLGITEAQGAKNYFTSIMREKGI